MALKQQVVIDEFLVRMNNGPMAYHVVPKTVVKDGDKIISETLGMPLNMKQAEDAGFSLTAIMGDVQAAALKDMDDARAAIDEHKQAQKSAEEERDASVAALAKADEVNATLRASLRAEVEKPITDIVVERLKGMLK